MERIYGDQGVEEKLSSHLGWFFGLTSAVLLGVWWAILATAVSWLWKS